MGGKSWESRLHPGIDGRFYMTVADAADATLQSVDTAGRAFKLVPADGLVDLPKKSGRRPTHVIEVSEVQHRREEILEKLGVAAELRDLRQRASEAEAKLAEAQELYDAGTSTLAAQSDELSLLRRSRSIDVTRIGPRVPHDGS